MKIESISQDLFAGSNISNRESFNYLVIAALQEELDEFYLLSDINKFFTKVKMKESDAFKLTANIGRQTLKILTYTPNKMGMPFNAASIMRIISLYQPVNTFFIGTCAGLKNKNRSIGDVLVPHRVFSYESGKYESGGFFPDYMSYETGGFLRKEAEHLNSKIKNTLNYKVITDEDFCSGAAIINDAEKREQVLKHSARKVSGLDMEAYSLACINSLIMAEKKEVLVIKGIMDFAMNKDAFEESGGKDLAKKNSAAFAYALIQHLDSTIFNPINQIRDNIIEGNTGITSAHISSIDKQLSIGNGIIVHSAIYGADGDNRDVADKISLLASRNVWEFEVGNWLVDGPEPSMGKEKTLLVDYTINGIRKTKPVYERNTFKFA